MEPPATGNGYWLIASDGGLFAYGDAPSVGAATDQLPSPVAGMTRTPSGLHILAEDSSQIDKPSRERPPIRRPPVQLPATCRRRCDRTQDVRRPCDRSQEVRRATTVGMSEPGS
jgi:hypothetical protein